MSASCCPQQCPCPCSPLCPAKPSHSPNPTLLSRIFSPWGRHRAPPGTLCLLSLLRAPPGSVTLFFNGTCCSSIAQTSKTNTSCPTGAKHTYNVWLVWTQQKVQQKDVYLNSLVSLDSISPSASTHVHSQLFANDTKRSLHKDARHPAVLHQFM